MTTSKGKSSSRRYAERILLILGVLGIGVWVASLAAPAIWQGWQNWVFDRQAEGKPATFAAFLGEMHQDAVREVAGWFGVHQAPAPVDSAGVHAPASPPQPQELAPNALIGRIAIPRLHMSSMVREGTSASTLLLTAGHIRGTSLPGQAGNVAVAAHRDTLFRALSQIRKNDFIEFETLGGHFTYQVASLDVVTPQDVGVLKPGKYPELTLVTCYPFDYIGSAPNRFIVKARQISHDEVSREQLSQVKTSQPETLDDSAPPRTPPPLVTVAQRVPTAPGVERNSGPSIGRVSFQISKRQSRQLAPGISVGVSDTDVNSQEMSGWMWLMPERRTIWLRDEITHDPVIFYQDGERRELNITSISDQGVTGYLLLHGE